MTKGQKIKESFGESWNLLTYSMQHHILTTHHWVDRSQNRMNLSPKDLGFDEETECEVHCEFWRPIQLKGIENNNGWILIWEKRLPFSNVACHFVSKEIIYTGIFVFETRKFIDSTGKIHFIDDVTHYQLIENPKPPIY